MTQLQNITATDFRNFNLHVHNIDIKNWMFLCGQIQPEDTTEFMNAASQGKLSVIDKYLADGGNPNVHDEVRSPCGDKTNTFTTTSTNIFIISPAEEDGTTPRLSGRTRRSGPSAFRTRSRYQL